MNKNEILSELFFSMNCTDITNFCRIHNIFDVNECVMDYHPSSLGQLIDDLHKCHYHVTMEFYSGISDSYILCRKTNNNTYSITFLADDNEKFTDAFGFNETIAPLLLANSNLFLDVMNRSGRSLTADEKKFILGAHKISIEIQCPYFSDVINIMNQVKGIIDKHDVFDGAKIIAEPIVP